MAKYKSLLYQFLIREAGMMKRFLEGFLLMISAQRRQQIGQLIRGKRKYLQMDQATLAIKIWGDELSPGALQSRISRIERGESWSDYKLIFEVIETLELWDDVLETEKVLTVNETTPEYITFDQMLPLFEKYIPNLREALKMLYTYSLHGQVDLFYRQLAILYDTAQSFNTSQKQNL